MTDTVQAAGGLVVRRAAEGHREVCLVHRPKHRDWSFPKGKLEVGEDFEAAAVREVLEETGLRCTLERHVGDVSYRDARRRPKVVRYWLMSPVEDGGFRPTDEIDEIRWLPLPTAREQLTYRHDRRLLDDVLDDAST